MDSESAGQTPAKGRRKLKRVMQKTKKSKVNLNSSSVVYYKKVKAALNASLNSSKVSQTLKANNKALAQSLQHIKQELRSALNENGRLRAENQDLHIQLRRLQSQVNSGQEQVNYEQRLHSLKSVLNSMSHHLLDMGTCVSDAVDLCQCPTPRTSQSSTSRPQSLEEYKVTEDVEKMVAEELSDLPDQSAQQLYLDTEEEIHPSKGEAAKAVAIPDMSIILEQSLIMDTEGDVQPETHMETVSEEPSIKSKAGLKKPLVLSKLPQRLCRDGGTYEAKKKASKRKCVTPNMELPDVDSDDKSWEAPQSPPNTRRETFVVRKETKLADSDSMEDISSITLPELVSGSPMKDDKMPGDISSSALLSAHTDEISADQSPIENPDDKTLDPALMSSSEKTSADNVKVPTAVSSKDRRKSGRKKDKLSADKNKQSAAVCSKERRKSAEKKTEAQSKNSKGAVPKHADTVKPPQKEAEFFISNPCALNLVHKRVTGSSDGCLNSETDDVPKPSLNPVDLFMAEIKEANRKSSKVASFVVTDAPETVLKARKSAEKDGDIRRVDCQAKVPADLNAHQRSLKTAEMHEPDQTMYFDADMEFTAILPQTQKLEIEPSVEQQDKVEESKAATQDIEASSTRSKEKAASEQQARKHTRSKSQTRSGKTKAAEEDKSSTDEDLDKVGSGDDKKLAVALRVNKPGQMVFAASRKEDDGSRKAIPAKLQNKARSKSKKQKEDMVKNLPQTEPESVFDFHDQTPRHTVNEGKSVFDLSMNDTATGIVLPSLTALRDKMTAGLKEKVSGNETEKQESTKQTEGTSAGEGKSNVVSLLGDKPVYAMPLKDTSCHESEPESCSRGRSASRGRQSGRQSRSRSRSKKDAEGSDKNVNPERTRGRSRSRSKKDGEGITDSVKSESQRGRSRSRSKKDGEGITDSVKSESQRGRSRSRKRPEIKGEDVEPVRRGRSRSRGRRSQAEERTDQVEDCNEGLRRSARSKSKGQITYTDECEESILADEQETGKKQKDDDEYVPSKPMAKVQQRGRSRRRKCDMKSGDEQHNTQEKVTAKTDNKHIQKIRTREANTTNDAEALLLPAQSLVTSNDVDEQIQSSKAEISTGDSASRPEPGKLVTDQRHRSKSSCKKLYKESDSESISNPFQSPDKTSQENETNALQIKDHVSDRKVRHRTRSKGTVLKEPAEGDSQEGNVSKTSPKTSLQQDEGREKRKVSVDTCESPSSKNNENMGSPSKKLRIDALRKSQVDSNNLVIDEKVSENISDGLKQDSTSAGNTEEKAATVVKKRRSSLPVAVTREEEGGKKQSTPTQSRSKKGSRIPDSKSGEMKSIQADFEEVKRKLKALSQSDVETSESLPAQPVKKSRPLMLPPSHSSGNTASKKTSVKPSRILPDHSDLPQGKPVVQPKKEKSKPGSPKKKKESKSHGGSPVPMPQTKSISPASSSNSDVLEDGSHAETKRIRRAATSVNYKEPDRGSKLRRGDPFTSFLHKEDAVHIYKSPKNQQKRGKSGRVERGAFHDLTNLSITEKSAE